MQPLLPPIIAMSFGYVLYLDYRPRYNRIIGQEDDVPLSASPHPPNRGARPGIIQQVWYTFNIKHIVTSRSMD